MDSAELERSLREKKNEMFYLGKLLTAGQMASSLFHELNQPMCGVRGFSQLAQAKLDPESPAFKYLTTVVEQTERLTQLLSQFRALMEPSVHDKQSLEIHDLIDRSLKWAEQQTKSRNIAVKKEYTSPSPRIQGCRADLEQAILLLYANARDAIAQKKSGSGTITVRTSLEGLNVRVEFADDGCGMPPVVVEKLFTPFFTGTKEKSGCGLGLFIVRMIVQDHSGTIHIQSQEGKGTQVILTFPKLSEG